MPNCRHDEEEGQMKAIALKNLLYRLVISRRRMIDNAHTHTHTLGGCDLMAADTRDSVALGRCQVRLRNQPYAS